MIVFNLILVLTLQCQLCEETSNELGGFFVQDIYEVKTGLQMNHFRAYIKHYLLGQINNNTQLLM